MRTAVRGGTARLRKGQRGQAIAEYVYVVPIMLLLIFGAIQFAFIYQAKSTLNYATFVATRQGALKNGDMQEIQDALAGGLAPLFTHDQTLEALKAAYAFADRELRDPKITRIVIVSPTSAALSVYQGMSQSKDEIPNDNLMYRPTDVFGSAGMNIQDANLLKVRVTYCFRMVAPIINKLIYHFTSDPATIALSGSTASAMLASDPSGTLSNTCTVPEGEYRLPISAEAVVRMQTPFKNPRDVWSAP